MHRLSMSQNIGKLLLRSSHIPSQCWRRRLPTVRAASLARQSAPPRAAAQSISQHIRYITTTTMNAPSSIDGGDLIGVHGLVLTATTGLDSWHRPRPQPVTISIWIKTSVGLAGSTDHLGHSINYGELCRQVTACVQNQSFDNLQYLAEQVANVAFDMKADWVKVHAENTRGLLRADSIGLSIVRRKDGTIEEPDRMYVRNLKVPCIIGVNECERLEKQDVIVNLSLSKDQSSESTTGPTINIFSAFDIQKIVCAVTAHIEASSYLTIEAFVTEVAKVICVDGGVDNATVKCQKPEALTFADSSSVEISRHKSFFTLHTDETTASSSGVHKAYIAFGSNMGDRVALIESALQELNTRGISIRKTSSLYESVPMYFLDQATFLNGVCQVETVLSPKDLLTELKSIEDKLGRVKLIEKGPRTIDLDILLYDFGTISIADDPYPLTIPHIHMLEREFVLRPLCDIAANLPHPHTSTSFANHLKAIPGPSQVATVTKLSPSLPTLKPCDPKRTTYTMAVINLTPDSFSDGGKHTHDNLLETVSKAVSQGATIIDLGGMSTRPGAADVTEIEELDRVVPAIQVIRSSPDERVRSITISVDTFRASVAKAAVEAGANIVNDISGGLLDSDMLKTVADLNVPMCVMHTRGTPKTMNKLATYPGGVVETVGLELEERVEAAYAAGIKRWNIILDPGLGFAKNLDQNLELIRRLPELRDRQALRGIPWLLGPSRKRFVGTVTGVDQADRRQWGTAGAVAACIAGGADIIRVHDVNEMRKVSTMAEAIWRY